MATCSSADSVLDAASQIKSNSTKLDTFVNGTSTQTVQLGDGDPTPTLRKFVADAQDVVTQAALDAGETVLDDVAALALGKADKVSNASSGNFAGLDETGNLTDSGRGPEDLAKIAGDAAHAGAQASSALDQVEYLAVTYAEESTENANRAVKAELRLHEAAAQAEDLAEAQSVLADAMPLKADKVPDASAGHFAGLDAAGNLTDSDRGPEDLARIDASAAQAGSLAASALDQIEYLAVSYAEESAESARRAVKTDLRLHGMAKQIEEALDLHKIGDMHSDEAMDRLSISQAYVATACATDAVARSLSPMQAIPGGIPLAFVEGDLTGMTKDEKKDVTFIYGSVSASAKMSWQGASSLAWPKKNYRIKFDSATSLVDGWGARKKWNLKADYVDASQLRNAVCANLWGQIVRARQNPDSRLIALPNCGAVASTPVGLVLNGRYAGLYNLQTAKDEHMFGMGSGTDEYLFCADGINSTNAEITAFRSATADDQNNAFELEYATDEEDAAAAYASLNSAIRGVLDNMSSPDWSELEKHIDFDSAIDLYVFNCLTTSYDCVVKNYMMASYDGVKWIFSVYDMDNTFGNYWNNSVMLPIRYTPNFMSYRGTPYSSSGDGPTYHNLMKLIETHKLPQLKSRYAELRNSVMSEDNVYKAFIDYGMQIPKLVYNREQLLWPKRKCSSVSDMHQILAQYRLRTAFLDSQVDNL